MFSICALFFISNRVQECSRDDGFKNAEEMMGSRMLTGWWVLECSGADGFKNARSQLDAPEQVGATFHPLGKLIGQQALTEPPTEFLNTYYFLHPHSFWTCIIISRLFPSTFFLAELQRSDGHTDPMIWLSYRKIFTIILSYSKIFIIILSYSKIFSTAGALVVITV